MSSARRWVWELFKVNFDKKFFVVFRHSIGSKFEMSKFYELFQLFSEVSGDIWFLTNFSDIHDLLTSFHHENSKIELNRTINILNLLIFTTRDFHKFHLIDILVRSTIYVPYQSKCKTSRNSMSSLKHNIDFSFSYFSHSCEKEFNVAVDAKKYNFCVI